MMISRWARYVKHDIDIVVDRLVVKEGIQKRLTDSVETCPEIGTRYFGVSGAKRRGKNRRRSCKVNTWPVWIAA